MPEPEQDPAADEPRPRAVPSAIYLAAALFASRALVDVFLGANAGFDRSAVLNVVVDLGLAAALALGWERAVAVGILRVGIGWMLGAGVALGTLPPLIARFVVVVELLGAIALLLVLVGTPARGRLVVAGVLFAAYALVALSTPWTVPSLIEAAGAVTEIRGSTLDYRLSFPETGWREVDPDPSGEDHVGARRWFARPDVGGLVVIHTDLGASPTTLSLDAFQRRVTAELELQVEQVAVIEERELPRGRIVHAVWRDAEGDVHALVGLFVVPGVAYRITASAPAARFAELEAELRSIVESFDSGQ